MCEYVSVQKPVQVHNYVAKQLFIESLESNVWQDYSYTFLSVLQAQVLIGRHSFPRIQYLSSLKIKDLKINHPVTLLY